MSVLAPQDWREDAELMNGASGRFRPGADVAPGRDMAKTLVRDIMSSPVEYLSVGDSLDLARHLMTAGRIRHLPVIDGDERLIGLVTHRKLLGAWVSHGDPKHEQQREIAREIPVDMLMETKVRTIAPDAPAAEAARLIEAHKIGCLPVVAAGKLVGIVTELDFVRFARKLLEPRKIARRPARGENPARFRRRQASDRGRKTGMTRAS